MIFESFLRGAAAGAAGTTALNTVTYLDMLVRGRPASSTPEDTAERAAEAAGVSIPGDDESRGARVQALGALSGLVTGIGSGVVLGLARSAGLRPPLPLGAVLATALALVGSVGPMTALGVTDPRSWSVSDWVSDLVPHATYGIVTAAVVQGLDR